MSKDIVIRERFVFPPNFRRALAFALHKDKATDADIREWLHAIVLSGEEYIAGKWYDSKGANYDGA